MTNATSFSKVSFTLSLFTLLSCGNPSQFKAGLATDAIKDGSDQSKKVAETETLLTLSKAFRFELIPAGGKAIVRQGMNEAEVLVYRDDAEEPLKGAAAASWTANLKAGSSEPTPGSLGTRALDLSQQSGMTTISANFQNSEGRSGQVSRSLFVDGEAPKISLIELATSTAGDLRTLYWSAIDNYQIAMDRTSVYACLATAPVHLVKNFDELSSLPESCAWTIKGDELRAMGEQITVSATIIGEQEYQPSQLVHYLYAEDLVGLNAATPMTPAARNAALLRLDVNPSTLAYTNQSSFKVPLNLTFIDQGLSVRVDLAPASWAQYGIQAIRKNDSVTSSLPFDAQLSLDLGAMEGPYQYMLQAKQTASGLLSNEKMATIILDRTPPLVSAVQIQVPGGFLDATADVTINWNASDANGIAKQTIEYQLKGETTWTKITDLPGNVRTYTFPWGARPAKGFSVRVTAEDPATNAGSGLSLPWAPQIFNAAVLTSSVECFYCHMRIEGDVGGINFPSNTVMDARGDSGEQFRIIGKLYSTNHVPNIFKRQIAANQMSVSGGMVENYDNSGVKIFPSQKDAQGVPVFPTLTVDLLKDRMNGTVTNGNGTRVSRIHEGNLVLTGTQASPITLNGEVLINGDLVIKGVYQGIGSLYAKNVYVVDDLVSIDCVPGASTCPFPFAGTTDDEKIASAKTAIKAKRAALYLAGIKQTVVGGVSPEWGFALANPYAWLPENDYKAMCSQGAYLKKPNGSNFATPDQFYDPTNANDIRARCEVGHVDAFIYGHDLIAWRAYGNYLINGGFVGYKAALLSTVPYHVSRSGITTGIPLNPRNGMPASQNVIRYDWRLRAGGAGFESLKLLFDQ